MNKNAPPELGPVLGASTIYLKLNVAKGSSVFDFFHISVASLSVRRTLSSSWWRETKLHNDFGFSTSGTHMLDCSWTPYGRNDSDCISAV